MNVGRQPYEQVAVFLLDRADAVPQPNAAGIATWTVGQAWTVAESANQLRTTTERAAGQAMLRGLLPACTREELL